jgi:hypothetical protein
VATAKKVTAKKVTAKKAPAKKAPAKKAPATDAPAANTAAPVTSSTVQYRVVVGKGDERVEGPDDAGTIFVCGVADAMLDPTVAYMQGKLKATGHTGVILEQLWSGAAAGAISRLASRP